jgi:PKD domain
VWDGAVPYIPGAPTSIPNNFFVRAFARFVLAGKAAQIADAVSPGGSGNPYAGLDEVERAVLLEVTRMGVPLRAWEDYAYVLGLNAPDGLLGFGGVIQAIDPTYADDFWSKPGYLGTEQSALGERFRAALTSDNRWSLALLAYHRYQVPKRAGFYPWDQFRGPDGQPLYPQRFLEIGPLISRSVTGGGTFSGRITAKVIVVANLLDADAYPWQADWYSARVREALGERYNDTFRLWYNDNADHIGPRTQRLVQYNGILQQALRDVSAWAERGVAPPESTRYTVADSQISVPDKAPHRRGIQPVVDLTVNGATRIDIAAGETVTFKARIQVPPKAGEIVRTEWDFLGTGAFTERPFGPTRRTVEVKVTFTYTTPGTYYPALRVTAQREGDTTTPFALVQNLGRVRVVVH